MVGESQGRLTQKWRRFHPVAHCLHCRDDDDDQYDDDDDDGDGGGGDIDDDGNAV